jgi:hypothetical protein
MKTTAFYVKIGGNTQIHCVGKVLYETQMCERVFGPWNDPRFKNTKKILKRPHSKSIHLYEAEKRRYIRGPSGVNYFSKQPAKGIEILSLSVFYARWNSVWLSKGLASSITVGPNKHINLCIIHQRLLFFENETNRCTEFQFYWYYDSTCFGQSFCPSSGVLSCTSALVQFMQFGDRVLPGCAQRIHHDARSYSLKINVFYITGIRLASQKYFFFSVFVLILIVIYWIACGVCNLVLQIPSSPRNLAYK